MVFIMLFLEWIRDLTLDPVAVIISMSYLMGAKVIIFFYPHKSLG